MTNFLNQDLEGGFRRFSNLTVLVLFGSSMPCLKRDKAIYLVVNDLRIITQRGNLSELNNNRSELNMVSMRIGYGASGGIGSSLDSVLRRRASCVIDDSELEQTLGHVTNPCTGPLTCDILIWLVVRVPVLSEQITLAHPSVSTLGRFRTIAFF